MPEQDRALTAPDSTATHSLTAAQFQQRFRWLIFHTWNIPPVFGLGVIFLIGVLSPGQMFGVISTPIEPAYVLLWLGFAMWFLPRQMRPLSDWLEHTPGSSSAAALRAVRRFPLLYWMTFLSYLALAPASVIFAAEFYTGFVATPVDWFRIQLVALIVSIIVGLPIFFRIFDLFGQALGGLELTRPVFTIKTKVFLIGALVPLLIDTMLVQYYWTRTGYFTFETFGVWLLLEGLAIGGSLIFARSFGQSLAPLQMLLGAARPLPAVSVAALTSRSTDELGVLTGDYRKLLDELRLHADILDLNNRLLRSAGGAADTATVLISVVDLCQQAVDADQAFLIVYDAAKHELVGVAQTGATYRPDGHYRLRLDETSLAVWSFNEKQTVTVEDATRDPRVSPGMRARFAVQSALATPLRLGDQTLGVLMAISRQPRRYVPRDLGVIEGLAREAASALHTQLLRAEREQAETARREQADQVVLLLDATVEGIYGLDRDGRCTFINRAALQMLGYARPEDLIGRNLHERIQHTQPDGTPYPTAFSKIQRAVQTGVSLHAVDELHWRADGTSFPVEYWSRPMLRDRESVGAVVSFVDITERRASETELARHREHLEELVRARTTELETANRELDAFSYSVSHDLRAPLRAIDGFARILNEDFGTQLDPQARDYLDRVCKGAERMGLLIDDLLQLSRVSRGEMVPADVDLSAMAHEIIAQLAAAEPERSVATEIAPALRTRGDARLLHVALTNLLSNAWKYTGKTISAHIEFSGEHRDGEHIFHVRDNGVGFDMQHTGRLFGAFQRLHGPEFPGNGIGLATVARIVRRHGGRVWAESEPGKGAAFFFTI